MAHRAGLALLLVAVGLVATGPVAAQVLTNPVSASFETAYFVNGRIVDLEGWPVNQATVEITISGLKGVTVKPFFVGTNCFGDFSGYVDIRDLAGSRPTVTTRILPPEDGVQNYEEVVVTEPLDKLFRTTNVVMKLPFKWDSECQEARSFWPGRATVWGRVVDGSAEHDRNGTTVYGDPVQYWPVDLLAALPDGTAFRSDRPTPTDERGDFKYSWTFQNRVDAVEINVLVRNEVDNRTRDFDEARLLATYDPFARVAFVKVNVGETPKLDAPAAAPLAALAVLVGAALVARRGRGA